MPQLTTTPQTNAFNQLKENLSHFAAQSETDFTAALAGITQLGATLEPEVRHDKSFRLVNGVMVCGGMMLGIGSPFVTLLMGAALGLGLVAVIPGFISLGVGCGVGMWVSRREYGHKPRQQALENVQNQFNIALNKMKPHAAVQNAATCGAFIQLCRRLGCDGIAKQTEVAARMHVASLAALGRTMVMPALEGPSVLRDKVLPSLDVAAPVPAPQSGAVLRPNTPRPPVL